MINQQMASLGFQMTLNVRNKVLSAYKDIEYACLIGVRGKKMAEQVQTSEIANTQIANKSIAIKYW